MSWSLDLGDGSALLTGTGTPPEQLTHTYAAGSYDARLSVTDLAGSTVIYVTTTDGELRRFVGSTWAQILGVTGASYPTFPG